MIPDNEMIVVKVDPYKLEKSCLLCTDLKNQLKATQLKLKKAQLTIARLKAALVDHQKLNTSVVKWRKGYRSQKSQHNVRWEVMKHIKAVGDYADQAALIKDVIYNSFPSLVFRPALHSIQMRYFIKSMNDNRRWLNTNIPFVQNLLALVPQLKPYYPFSPSKFYRDRRHVEELQKRINPSNMSTVSFI